MTNLMISFDFQKWASQKYDWDRNGEVCIRATGKVMKHTIDKKGYHRVHLSIGGVKRSTGIHRLVAMKYIPLDSETFEGFEVNHKDCNKSNNRPSNLEWTTHAENMDHARKHKRMTKDCLKKDIRNDAILDLHSIGWSTTRIAAALNITQPRVALILKREKDE